MEEFTETGRMIPTVIYCFLVTFLSDFKILSSEQHVNTKFCVLIWKSFSRTFQVLTEAYGNKVMKTSQMYDWHKYFYGGHPNTEDNPCSGNPTNTGSEENIRSIHQIILV